MDSGDNPLSKREQETLTLVARGLTNQEIARELVISPNTVKVHLRNVYAKLEVASRTEATVTAARAGWIQVTGLAEDEPEAEAAPAVAPAEPPLQTWQRVYFVAAAFIVLAALLAPGLLSSLQAAAPASDFSDLGLVRLGAPPRSEAGRWSSLAALPSPRSRLALVGADGLLFAIGGEDEDGASSAVAVYDPDTNGWLPRSDKPLAVSNIQAALLDGLIYVPGGTDGAGQVGAALEVYDPERDAWQRGADLPQPRAGYALAALDGRLYLFGGWDGTAYLDSALVYDPARDAWETRASLPVALGFAAAVSLGDRIFVVGGFDGTAELAGCNIYRPQEDRWLACAPLIAPRGGLGLAAEGTSLYAVGGGWQRLLSFNERYDTLTDTWSSIPSPVQGQWRSLGVASLGPDIYALGGWSGDYLAVNEVFRGTFRSFLPLGSRGQ